MHPQRENHSSTSQPTASGTLRQPAKALFKERLMASQDTHSALFAPIKAPVHPELLISAALHLMTHYTSNADTHGCTRLASVIERHMIALAELPDLAPVLRATCRQLADEWATVVERDMPEPGRIGFFTRLATGKRI
jgi:hypothetical protein